MVEAMNAKRIAELNRQIEANLAKGRGRKVIVKLDKAAKEQLQKPKN